MRAPDCVAKDGKVTHLTAAAEAAVVILSVAVAGRGAGAVVDC